MGMNLLAGYLMMFSFAEILALAAIWAKLPLHVLKYSLAAVMASAAVLGIVLALVKRNGFTGNGEKTGKMSFYFYRGLPLRPPTELPAAIKLPADI